jgi:hypothetical protein
VAVELLPKGVDLGGIDAKTTVFRHRIFCNAVEIIIPKPIIHLMLGKTINKCALP